MSCAQARRALETYGLLLLQDKKLKSVVGALTGEALKTSWWSHPRAHEIFRCLETLEDKALTTRLIDGKVTYVHKRLWPALAGAGVPVVTEIHTASGRHERRTEESAEWAKRMRVKPLSVDEGRRQIAEAAAAIGASPRMLPWHSR